MRMKLGFVLLLISVAVIALLSATATQAASRPARASFGVMMKPGFGGGEDIPKNYTLILLLRCAMQSRYRDQEPGTRVVTGDVVWQGRNHCSNYPMRGMGSGEPLGEGTYVGFFGTTDVFPWRYDPLDPRADR